MAYGTPSETTMNHKFHEEISLFTINLLEIHVQASEYLSPVECNGNTKSLKIRSSYIVMSLPKKQSL